MIKQSSKTNLFLIELMLMIVIFSLCSAVCVRIFVNAHLMSQYSNNLSNAALKAQSAASCYKAAHGDLSETAKLISGGYDNMVTKHYDSKWQESNADNAAFLLTIIKSGGKGTINVQKVNGDKIFDIDVKAVGDE